MFEAEINFGKVIDQAAADSIAANDLKLVNYGLPVDGKRPKDSKFNTYTYNGMTYDEDEIKQMKAEGKEHVLEQPKFLTNPNYYFMKPDEK